MDLKSQVSIVVQNTLVLAVTVIVERQKSFDSLVVRTICSYKIVI